MIIEIIQIRFIKLLISLAIGFSLKNSNKRCSCCGCELDVEDYFFNNICECCGSSQGYDKEDFDNSNLNYCEVKV